MKNLTLMTGAIAAALMLAGCQPKTDTNVTGETGGKPVATTGGQAPVADSKAIDTSGVMYAASFEQAVADAEKDDKLVLIKFTADWCGPCHEMSADMKKTDLSGQFDNIIPIEVDIDKEADGAAVKNHLPKTVAIPYLVLIDKEGKEIAKQTGRMPMDKFKAWLDENSKA